MFRRKLDYLAAVTVLSAISLIAYITPYFQKEFFHRQQISKIKNCSIPYQYNRVLEDFVTSEKFDEYFKGENFLEIYKCFRLTRLNSSETHLDHRINCIFSIGFSPDLPISETNTSKISSKRNRKKELIEELQKKKNEFEKN